MKEFNNREIAKKHAEYITSKTLRKYVAQKVREYVGENPTVFDGACGSGQLEEFIQPRHLVGVEIQEAACAVCQENYPHSEIHNMSFFDFDKEVACDCVVMNPPFSIAFSSLSKEEQRHIQDHFPWKKSGKVDDIFILQSLTYTKRYGFYIAFPGITYRKTEQRFRTDIGNQLAELNIIQNGFEDTGIDVCFLVIDKDKTTSEVKKEIYDCKREKVIQEAMDEGWTMPHIEQPKEEIDIRQVTGEALQLMTQNLSKGIEVQLVCYELCEGRDFIQPLSVVFERIKQIAEAGIARAKSLEKRWNTREKGEER